MEKEFKWHQELLERISKIDGLSMLGQSLCDRRTYSTSREFMFIMNFVESWREALEPFRKFKLPIRSAATMYN
jgi:hypothetical protein